MAHTPRFMLSLVILLLSLVTLFSISPHTTHAADAMQNELVFEGLSREYYLVTPSDYDSTRDYPLLIVLNQLNTSGMAMSIMTGLDRLANEMDWLVVFAEHASFYWDDGRVVAGLPPYGEQVNDIGYIEALIEHLGVTHNARQDEVYLVAYRGSGGMAYQLACQLPSRFKGVAVVSALMFAYQTSNCVSSNHNTDLLILHSATDSVFYMEGNDYVSYLDRDENRYQTLRPDETFGFWLALNNCNSQATKLRNYDVIMSQGCDDDARVAYVNLPYAGDSWIRMGAYRINQMGIDMTQIIQSFFKQEENWYIYTVSDPQTDDIARSYTLYIPPTYTPDTPTPLMVILHMRPGDGSSTAYISDMNRVARENNFIVVYPDGYDHSWNYLYGFEFDQDDGDHDDGLFLINLIEDLKSELNIDPARVYGAGISRGGFMMMRMICEYPRTFAAVGVISATAFPGLDGLCDDNHYPTPIMLFHGTADRDVEFNGETGDFKNDENASYEYEFLSAPDTARYWATYNECTTQQETTIPQTGRSPDTAVTKTVYSGCIHDANVEFFTIVDGGHNWPGIDGRLPQIFYGNVTQDIQASDELWHFFERYTLREPVASP